MSAFDSRYLECRDLGHAWERASDVVRTVEGGVRSFKRVLQCTRCKTLRKDEFRVTDSVSPKGRQYAYPKGYVVKGGLSRSDARMLLFYPRTSR